MLQQSYWRTTEKYWWSEDPQRDPWVWREIIARRGDIAYGKFFHNKAGFISKKWFPYFANYRRAGYDFDARWDDELASFRQKKIMDLFMDDRIDEESDAEFAAEKQDINFGRNPYFNSSKYYFMDIVWKNS